DPRPGCGGPLRHLDPRQREKMDAFVAREAANKPPEDVRARAVVRDGRPQGLAVRTAWERGTLPADALAWGSTRVPTSAFRPGDVVAIRLTGQGPDKTARFALDQEPQVEGAVIAIDPYTGEVKAMVGGYDFRRSQFNRAVQARRQPGSGFTTLIYAAAVDHGYTPASLVLAAPS